MGKIATGILLAALCWGLAAGGDLAEMPNVAVASTGQSAEFDKKSANNLKKEGKNGSDVNDLLESINETTDVAKGDNPNSGTKDVVTGDDPSSGEDPVDPPLPPPTPPSPDKDDTFFHMGVIVGLVVNLLLIVCVFLLFKNLWNKLARKSGNLQEINKGLKKLQEEMDSVKQGLKDLNGEINTAKEEKLRGEKNTVKIGSVTAAYPSDEMSKKITTESKNLKEKNSHDSSGYSQNHRNIEKIRTMDNTSTRDTAAPHGSGGVAIVDGQSTNTTKTDMVGDFNEMLRCIAEKPLDPSIKEKKQQFVDTYNVKYYMCENYNTRINNPNEQPIFGECSAASKATIWCVWDKEKWIIFPAPRDYDETAHTNGGLETLFTSNYREGSYRIIKVNWTATASKDFRRIRKGNLKLSEE